VRTLADVDWKSWSPAVRATLLFVVRDERILLIRKKRGLGAGKINGPGGKIDAGESPLVAAIREVQEEIGVTPERVEQHGEILFQFTDGLALEGFVFLARDCTGSPRETDEATPLWTPVDRIPYARMWADDVSWMPMLLAGEKFRGRALFDADALLDQRFETLPRVIGGLRYFIPALRISGKRIAHQGRTVGHIAVARFAVHGPAIDTTAVFFYLHDMRNAVSPLGGRHATGKIIAIEPGVGVCANQSKFYFHPPSNFVLNC